ncbi:Precorrin-2 dehydrogenase [Methanocorpusculaceae archaeon Sp1]|nr:Precorrin-2 dehydrogenase [Methanocorpusculaceae archaeon Sp1]
MIPLMLDLSAKRVLLFGAGAVGVRKARHFSGCKMTVVSRDISPEIFSLPQVSIKQMDISELEDEDLQKLIERHDFVIAALSDAGQNERITKLANACGRWCNTATGDGSTFLIPSTIAGEEYTIAVSTSGLAPAVPRFIREDLEERYQGLDNMIHLMHGLREQLKATTESQEARAEVLRAILRDERIWQACRENTDCADLVLEYL